MVLVHHPGEFQQRIQRRFLSSHLLDLNYCLQLKFGVGYALYTLQFPSRYSFLPWFDFYCRYVTYVQNFFIVCWYGLHGFIVLVTSACWRTEFVEINHPVEFCLFCFLLTRRLKRTISKKILWSDPTVNSKLNALRFITQFVHFKLINMQFSAIWWSVRP